MKLTDLHSRFLPDLASKHLVTSLAVLLIGLILRWFHYVGPMYAGDESAWLITSNVLWSGETEGVAPFTIVYFSRVFWLFILGAFNGLPQSIEAVHNFLFVTSAVNIGLVMASARNYFDDSRVSSLAGLFYAISPIAIANDIRALPDAGGMTCLLIGIWLSSKFVRNQSPLLFYIAVSFMGLSFGFKEYFPLFAIPTFYLLFDPDFRKQVKGHLLRYHLMIGPAVFLSVLCSVAAIKNAVLANPSVEAVSYSFEGGASDYIMFKDGSHLLINDLSSLIKNACLRLDYIGWLFNGSGAFLSVASVFAVVTCAIKGRNIFAIRYLLLGISALAGFLCFCPNPDWKQLTFIEMQPRYMYCLFPFLSLMAGWSLVAVWDCIYDREVRRALFCLFVIGSLGSILVLNDHRSRRYGEFHSASLNAAIEHAALNNRELLVLTEGGMKEQNLRRQLGAFGREVQYVDDAKLSTLMRDADLEAEDRREAFYLYVYDTEGDETWINGTDRLVDVDLQIPHTSLRKLLSRLGFSLPGRFAGQLLAYEP